MDFVGEILVKLPLKASDVAILSPQISSFSKGQPLPLLQVPEQVAQASRIPPLKKPPRWIRRPSGVSFAVSITGVW